MLSHIPFFMSCVIFQGNYTIFPQLGLPKGILTIFQRIGDLCRGIRTPGSPSDALGGLPSPGGRVPRAKLKFLELKISNPQIQKKILKNLLCTHLNHIELHE